MPSGVPSRLNPRPTMQRRHDQAAVFSQHPLVQSIGQPACLLSSVFFKGSSVFDDFGGFWKARQVRNLQAFGLNIAKNFSDFLQLLWISSSDDDNHGNPP